MLRSGHGDPRTKVFDIAVRAKRLDEAVRRFVTRHADAVVLDLGAGLDGRIFRVDPPSTVPGTTSTSPRSSPFGSRWCPGTRTRAASAPTSPAPGGWTVSPPTVRP
jgi:hypothetical protein